MGDDEDIPMNDLPFPGELNMGDGCISCPSSIDRDANRLPEGSLSVINHKLTQ